MDKESPTSTLSNDIFSKKRRLATGKPLFVLTVYTWTFPIVILITFIAGFLLGYYLRQPTNPSQAALPTAAAGKNTTDQNQNTRQQVLELLANQTKNYIGNEQASVRMYEFSDFRCPYCAKYNLETGKKIFSKYIDQGKVYLGFVHLAILGEDSVRAALASECAAEQGKFWEYHELLFAQRQGGNTPDYSNENLKALAQQLELNLEAFSECLDTGRYTATVVQQTQFARQLGLTSTPSFLINGKAIIGAQPYEVFEGIIEEALKQTSQ
ncbi:MAG: DsbA family protein [Anaerolineales bacterium]|nr:DsbA family protein [Anaerolineales bacterium]